ncbi:uncharacterized protein LOC132722622 [Ruditapes philippinarum]|uniref:uncharacterized protein LOC132722622 n=1 Tax=Ruditapes philippinarum TaxID=129788 RepID=UPI00295B4632|nr:uncharacterized protein LOC132722622 [Ruditapes philippinarum]
MLLYADDIVCIAKTEEDLQRILDTLRDWCRRWRVLINTEKSKCVHFRRGRAACTDFSFRIGENVLELVDSYKYLGVTFHCKGDFSSNADILAKSAGRALGKTIAKVRDLKHFGFNTFEKLFDSCVVPIMNYCSSVWGYRKYQVMENVQHRAIRYYLGVHRFAPILAITGDIEWVPTNYRRWLNMLRMWNRLVSLDDNRITKQVFNVDYSHCQNNWCSEMKDIMSKIGMNDNFINRQPINLATAKHSIIEHHKTD